MSNYLLGADLNNEDEKDSHTTEGSRFRKLSNGDAYEDSAASFSYLFRNKPEEAHSDDERKDEDWQKQMSFQFVQKKESDYEFSESIYSTSSNENFDDEQDSLYSGSLYSPTEEQKRHFGHFGKRDQKFSESVYGPNNLLEESDDDEENSGIENHDIYAKTKSKVLREIEEEDSDYKLVSVTSWQSEEPSFSNADYSPDGKLSYTMTVDLDKQNHMFGTFDSTFSDLCHGHPYAPETKNILNELYLDFETATSMTDVVSFSDDASANNDIIYLEDEEMFSARSPKKKERNQFSNTLYQEIFQSPRVSCCNTNSSNHHDEDISMSGDEYFSGSLSSDLDLSEIVEFSYIDLRTQQHKNTEQFLGEVKRMPLFAKLKPFELPYCENLYDIIMGERTERFEDYDVYIIEIETLVHHTHWIIKKRYSEIRAFHIDLHRTSPEVELPELPPKKFFKRQESVIEDRKVKFTEYFQLLMSLTCEDIILRRKFEKFLEIDNLIRYREKHDWVMIEYIKRIQTLDSSELYLRSRQQRIFLNEIKNSSVDHLSQYLKTTGYDVINLTIESYDDDTSILQKCEQIHQQMKFTKCQFILVKNNKDERHSLFIPCFQDDSKKSPLVMYFNPNVPSDIDYVICMTFRHLGNLNCHIYLPQNNIIGDDEIKKFVNYLVEYGQLSFLISDRVLQAFAQYLDSQRVMKMSIAEF